MLITHSASNDKWLIDVAKLNHSVLFGFFRRKDMPPLRVFVNPNYGSANVRNNSIVYLIYHKTFYSSHHCITDPSISLCIHCKCVRVLVCVRMHMLHTSINCMIGCYQLGFGASEFEFFLGGQAKQQANLLTC